VIGNKNNLNKIEKYNYMSVTAVCSWRQTACHNPFCFIPTSVHLLCCHVGSVICRCATPHLPSGLSWESCLGSCWSHHCPLLTWSHWGHCCGVVFVCLALLHCSCRCASGHRSHCSPTHRNVVNILKIEREKKTHKWDQEVTSPSCKGNLMISANHVILARENQRSI
jgi:hypothetical protein